MLALIYSVLMVVISIICYIEALKTVQPNNSGLHNVKYGKLPQSAGEAKNVSVIVYTWKLKLFTLYVCTVQLPCIWNNCLQGKFILLLLFHQQNHEDLKCFRMLTVLWPITVQSRKPEPTTKLINVPSCNLLFHAQFTFSCNTITFQKYFCCWSSDFIKQIPKIPWLSAHAWYRHDRYSLE